MKRRWFAVAMTALGVAACSDVEILQNDGGPVTGDRGLETVDGARGTDDRGDGADGGGSGADDSGHGTNDVGGRDGGVPEDSSYPTDTSYPTDAADLPDVPHDSGTFDAGAPQDIGAEKDTGGSVDTGATPDSGQVCKANGDDCTADGQCCTGRCTAGKCGTGTNLPDGAACTSNAQCCQGNCWKEVCGLPPQPGGTWPFLPQSCQGLRNRSHGSCVDTYADPNYGSIAWEFKGSVEQAIGEVGQPAGMFDGDTVFPEKRGEYARLVAGALDGMGLCSAWDGGELYVRDATMDYNETYSLFTGSGRPRAGGHWKCEPSDNIPGTHPPLPCGVPPSSNDSCAGPAKNYFDDVVSMVEEVIAEEQALGDQSKIIDFRFKSGHVRGWRLKDDGYPFVERMAVKATGRGYCVQSSGWKWIAIKRDNAMSETYSLVTHVNYPDPVTKPDLYAACVCDGILPSCEHIIEKAEETCQPAGF